jgi:hypothetical protein
MQSKNDTPDHDSNNCRPRLLWVDNGRPFQHVTIEGLVDTSVISFLPGHQQERGTVEQLPRETNPSTTPPQMSIGALYKAMGEFVRQWNAPGKPETDDQAPTTET